LEDQNLILKGGGDVSPLIHKGVLPMNRSAWMSAIMNSNIPQNLMKMFGYKRKKSRSMTYSIMGVVASAAAAFAFRNRMGDGMRQLFQNTSTGNSPNRAISPGLTEFAKEITSGMTDSQTTTTNSGYHASSSTNPESSQLISQIASAAKQEGNSQQVDQAAEQLIKRNL
jgi:hypothetical protein